MHHNTHCVVCVSTHAPAKGATYAGEDTFEQDLFQPTPPRREQLAMTHAPPNFSMFQPTLPRRARRPTGPSIGSTLTFQPTPLEESDEWGQLYELEGFVFQPTPPRRERLAPS